MLRRCSRKSEAERGQVLILFVALFTVLLLFAAFSIDQGLWLNHRRIAQKDADAAARAGAAAYLKSISDGEISPSIATYATAQAGALKVSAANGAGTTVGTAPVFAPGCDASTVTTCARASCPLTVGTPIAGAPSVEIAVPRPAPGLFVRALGGGDANDIGAKSTACVGSVKTIQITDHGGLPLAIYTDDSSCFDTSVSPSVPRIGSQCVLKNAAQGNQSRGYFLPPPDADCWDNGTPPGTDVITGGVNFTCQLNTSSGANCPPSPGETRTDCINSFNGTVGQNVPDDFVARLTRTTDNNCPTGATDPGSDAFSDIFSYADGRPGPVKGPPGLNSPPNVNVFTSAVDPFGTVYVHNACSTPRTALIIISDPSEQVLGFAAVYIVGCFDETVGEPDNPLTNVINDCNTVYNSSKAGHIELRGVIVNVYLTEEAAGDIGTITKYAPLAIQTTR